MKLTLGSGQEVVIAGHLHDGVYGLLPEALAQISASGEFIRQSIDLGRPVGLDGCVETSDGDEIVFAQRKGRPGLSRLVKRSAVPNSSGPLMPWLMARTRLSPEPRRRRYRRSSSSLYWFTWRTMAWLPEFSFLFSSLRNQLADWKIGRLAA